MLPRPSLPAPTLWAWRPGQTLRTTPCGEPSSCFEKATWPRGDRVQAGLTDPVERSLSEWVAVRFGWVGFERIAAFMRENPDWPAMAALGRRAEEALLVARKPAAVVRAFFAEQPPTTAAGKVALALAFKSDGLEHETAALVRDAWRNDTFGRELETKILDLFPGLLTQVDHRDRMERFLFRQNWTSALRAAGYASKDYVLLAKRAWRSVRRRMMPRRRSMPCRRPCAMRRRIASPRRSFCADGTSWTKPSRSSLT